MFEHDVHPLACPAAHDLVVVGVALRRRRSRFAFAVELCTSLSSEPSVACSFFSLSRIGPMLSGRMPLLSTSRRSALSMQLRYVIRIPEVQARGSQCVGLLARSLAHYSSISAGSMAHHVQRLAMVEVILCGVVASCALLESAMLPLPASISSEVVVRKTSRTSHIGSRPS